MVRGEMGLQNVDRALEMAKDVNEVLASRLVNEQVSIRLGGIKKIRFP